MNKAKPMPTGAMKVALCFSFASMKIVNTSSAVSIASIKTPWTADEEVDSEVRTLNSVGKRTLTI